MPSIELDQMDIDRLRALALAAIQAGLAGSRLVIHPGDYSEKLQYPRATFVTLTQHGQLRGCIGTLTARQSLVQNVVEHAYAAAFQDPRFTPLQTNELAHTALEISILTEPEVLSVVGEAELLAVLQPGRDGLILESGRHRATFLPSVWEQLPAPADFVRQLKIKAGLPANQWPKEMRVYRYAAEKI